MNDYDSDDVTTREDDDWIKIIFDQTPPKVDMKEEEEKRKMDGMANRVSTRVDAQGTQLDRTDPELFDFNAEVIQTQCKYFLSETIHNGSRGTHFAKFLISNFLQGLTYSAMDQLQILCTTLT